MKLESFSFNIFQSSEVTHLISCQPTALKAVRLQSLVPPNPDKIYIRDLLVKNEVRIHLFFVEDAEFRVILNMNENIFLTADRVLSLNDVHSCVCKASNFKEA